MIRVIALAKLTLSLGILAWCLQEIPLAEIRPLLQRARFADLLVLIPVIFVEALSAAWRLKVLLDTTHKIPVRTHFAQYFIASYFNIALPSSMGGDAVRIVLLSRCGVRVASASVAVLLDRLLGLYCLVFIALLASCTLELPPKLQYLLYSTALILVLAGLAAVLSVRWAKQLNTSWEWLEHVRQALDAIHSNPGALLLGAGLSLIFQCLTIGFTWIIARGFDIPVSASQVFALVPLTWLATMLPVSIGGLGVREVSFIYLFGLVGLASNEALFLSLGTYAVFIMIAIIGALTMALASNKPAPQV